MRCVHGGKTRVARGNRKRHGSRLKKGCGFQISFVRVGVIDVDPEDERVWWEITKVIEGHNHAVDKRNFNAHPAATRLPDDAKDVVKRLLESGMTPLNLATHIGSMKPPISKIHPEWVPTTKAIAAYKSLLAKGKIFSTMGKHYPIPR